MSERVPSKEASPVNVRDALYEIEERFRRLVENVQDYAVILIDPGGVVTSWNRGAANIFGYTEGEVVGQHFSLFYTAGAKKRDWPRHELTVAQQKGRFSDEGWRIRKDGTRFWASTVLTPIPSAEGGIRGFLKITRDMTESRRQEAALRESEERFRLLVDGVQEYAIFMLDAKGNIVSWNRGAEMIKGYSASEIIGSHFSRFYTDEARLHGKPAWELEMATRYGSVEDEGWRVRKDGSHFWANVIITALRDRQGRLRGFAKVTRDMTERRRIEALEQADREKDQFLALLAHELRNPLAPIRTALDVLRQPNATPADTSQAREIAERQLRHMARLLDDLLDISRIREGRVTLRKEVLNVAKVLGAAADAARPMIEARRHAFTVSCPETPILVSADPVRLEQVLGNLLNNAAKYSDPGGRIELIAERVRNEVIIRVRDNGIGIEPLMIPRIFDLFVQAERRMELSAGGVGIGLSLVRKLVELHGGRVEALSAGPGRGSEFIVFLPAVTEASTGTEAQPESAPAPSNRKALRVLLADDNVDSADGLGMLLELQGYEIRVAYDSERALETARSFRPHVALLDIGMPSMNGYELARRLREAPETRNTVLVAMTGWGQEEDQRKGREAGFAHYLVKPFEPSALERLLADVER